MKTPVAILLGFCLGAAACFALLYPKLQRTQADLDDIYKNTYGGTPEETKKFQLGLLDIVGAETALEYVKEDYRSRVIDKTTSDQAIKTVLSVGYLKFIEEGRLDEVRQLLSDSIVSFYRKHQGVKGGDGPASDTIVLVFKKIEEARAKSPILDAKMKVEQGRPPNPLQPSASGDR